MDTLEHLTDKYRIMPEGATLAHNKAVKHNRKDVFDYVAENYGGYGPEQLEEAAQKVAERGGSNQTFETSAALHPEMLHKG